MASLCCHLDGIPLAIELAAARVRALSVEEIDGKLDQRFRLLTGGSRTALPRQQTLRALIDWSYDLLDEPEQAAVAAAVGICRRLDAGGGGRGLRRRGVADWECPRSADFARRQEPGGRGADATALRYRLLETVRQYAREKLVESGGGEAVRERHRDYFLALAEEAEPKLIGAEQAEWLQRLEEEHENLRAGLDWSLVEAGSGGGLRLCGALQRFWFTRGHLAEGREWCARVLEKAGAEERTPERAKALNAAGSLAYYPGRLSRSPGRATRRAWRSSGNWATGGAWPSSLSNLGGVAWIRAILPRRGGCTRRAWRSCGNWDDRSGIATRWATWGMSRSSRAIFRPPGRCTRNAWRSCGNWEIRAALGTALN